MKRIICLILSLCLFLLPLTASASIEPYEYKETYDFDPSFTKEVHHGFSTWFSSAKGRAMFTFSIFLDYLIEIEDAPFTPALIERKSYVIRTNSSPYIFYAALFSEESPDVLMLRYNALQENAIFSILEDVSPLSVKLAFSTDEYTCYENDVESLYDVYQSFMSDFGS